MEITEVMDEATISFFFQTVFSGDWKNEDLANQIALRDNLEAFVSGANLLRETFDKAVWAGHADGSVSTEVKSIRAQRTGETPGRKAKELTPAEILAKRLGR